jgi:hypothetical protein
LFSLFLYLLVFIFQFLCMFYYLLPLLFSSFPLLVCFFCFFLIFLPVYI